MANPKKADKKKQKNRANANKKAADGNVMQRFWDNAWLRYQRKRIAAKCSGFKQWLEGGKWDGRTILSVVSVLVVLVAVCGMLFTFLEYRKSDRIYGKLPRPVFRGQ